MLAIKITMLMQRAFSHRNKQSNLPSNSKLLPRATGER
jgi:hypothetical protein